MAKSMLFLPIAILGALLLVLGVSPVAWVPLLVIGIVGTVGLSAAGATHDDELRREATGTGETQQLPDDPSQRA